MIATWPEELSALVQKLTGSSQLAAESDPFAERHPFYALIKITSTRANATLRDTLETILAEADLGLRSIVEMTSDHVGLRGHFEIFDRVRRARLTAPYPAWTAVEVVGLRRPGAVVEIRVIAALN